MAGQSINTETAHQYGLAPTLLCRLCATAILRMRSLGITAAVAWRTWRARDIDRRHSLNARTLSDDNDVRLLGIIRSAMEAIITVDESQRVVLFNPMAETLFGCKVDDAIGASLERFIPERYRKAHHTHLLRFGMARVAERPMGEQRQIYALRADGTEFPVEASISQVLDGDRKLYTVMMRDITERMQAEHALRTSQQELMRLSANIQKMREEEKTHIARELHDDLGQQLTALKMEVKLLEGEMHTDSTQPASLNIDCIYKLIDSLVASIRRIASDLRPVMLDDLGLPAAIDWLVTEFTTRYRVPVVTHIDTDDMEFSPEFATAVFRMIQEALTNVARHSGATQVKLDIVRAATNCVLWIADNGRGAIPNIPRSALSFGLLGLRERAAQLGGAVEIITAPGRGFTLSITLPVATIAAKELE